MLMPALTLILFK